MRRLLLRPKTKTDAWAADLMNLEPLAWAAGGVAAAGILAILAWVGERRAERARTRLQRITDILAAIPDLEAAP